MISLPQVVHPGVGVYQDHRFHADRLARRARGAFPPRPASRSAACRASKARSPASTSAVLVTPGCAFCTSPRSSSLTLSVIRTVCMDTYIMYVSATVKALPPRPAHDRVHDGIVGLSREEE